MGNAPSTNNNRRTWWGRLLAFIALLLASAWTVGAMRGAGVNPFVTPPPRFATAVTHPRGAHAPLGGIFANVAHPRPRHSAGDGEESDGSDLPWDQFRPRAGDIGDAEYAALLIDSWPLLFERRSSAPLPGEGHAGAPLGAGSFDAEPLLAAASLRPAVTGSSGGGGTGGSIGGTSSGGGQGSSGGGTRPDGTPPPGLIELPAPVVPEPATWLVMIAGFGTVGIALRLRRTAKRAPTLH